MRKVQHRIIKSARLQPHCRDANRVSLLEKRQSHRGRRHHRQGGLTWGRERLGRRDGIVGLGRQTDLGRTGIQRSHGERVLVVPGEHYKSVSFHLLVLERAHTLVAELVRVGACSGDGEPGRGEEALSSVHSDLVICHKYSITSRVVVVGEWKL